MRNPNLPSSSPLSLVHNIKIVLLALQTRQSTLERMERFDLTSQVISSRIVDVEPCYFGPDLLGICNGSEVLVLSSKTGEVVSTFQGHSIEITTCKLCSSNNDYALTGSSDGKVICWNITTGEIKYEFIAHEGRIFDAYELKSSRHGKEILLLIPDRLKSRHTSSKKNSINKKNDNVPPGYKVVVYDIERGENTRLLATYKYNTNPCISLDSAFMGHSESDEYIFVTKNNKISAWHSDRKIATTIKCSESSPITSLTVCGRGDVVITGHKNGVVLVCRGVGRWLQTASLPEQQQELPTYTVMHWHATAVTSVCLNATGTDVYSGGEEGVLVRWGLVGNDQGTKTFIPRLGAPVRFTKTSPENAEVAVATTDNCLRIYNIASSSVVWTLRLPCLAHSQSFLGGTTEASDVRFRCHTQVEPYSRCITLNGYPGQLQELDLHSRTLRAEHSVSHFTRVSRAGSGSVLPLYVPSVMLFRYSNFSFRIINHKQGHDQSSSSRLRLLATVDTRKGEGMDAQISLKIWACTSSSSHNSSSKNSGGGLKLLAQVDSPHQSSRVLSACWCPSSPVLVTTGSDGSVRVWHMTASSSMLSSSSRGTTISSQDGVPIRFDLDSGSMRNWRCAFAFTYRAVEATSSCFSTDGSLLVIAYRNLITMWDFETTSLKSTLLAPWKGVVTDLAFVEPRQSYQAGG